MIKHKKLILLLLSLSICLLSFKVSAQIPEDFKISPLLDSAKANLDQAIKISPKALETPSFLRSKGFTESLIAEEYGFYCLNQKQEIGSSLIAFDSAFENFEKCLEKYPGDSRTRQIYAEMRNKKINLLIMAGELGEAKKEAKAVIRMMQEAYEKNPFAPMYKVVQGHALILISETYDDKKDKLELLHEAEEVLEIADDIMANDYAERGWIHWYFACIEARKYEMKLQNSSLDIVANQLKVAASFNNFNICAFFKGSRSMKVFWDIKANDDLTADPIFAAITEAGCEY